MYLTNTIYVYILAKDILVIYQLLILMGNMLFHYEYHAFQIISKVQRVHETTSGPPFYLHGLTLIPAWISNHIHYKLCDEITYPFINFNGATVEV